MKDNTNRNFWDHVAKMYTKVQESSNKELYTQLCDKISPFILENKKVLELACGTGQLTSALCYKSAKWEATDFSFKMVQETEKRVDHYKIRCAVADATNLLYPANSFDIVIIANALHIMPDPAVALAEIKKVLKPNGILIAPTFVYDGKINKPRIWFMEQAGFKTFHKWKSHEYITFLQDHGFEVKRKTLIKGNMLPECLVVCKN